MQWDELRIWLVIYWHFWFIRKHPSINDNRTDNNLPYWHRTFYIQIDQWKATTCRYTSNAFFQFDLIPTFWAIRMLARNSFPFVTHRHWTMIYIRKFVAKIPKNETLVKNLEIVIVKNVSISMKCRLEVVSGDTHTGMWIDWICKKR